MKYAAVTAQRDSRNNYDIVYTYSRFYMFQGEFDDVTDVEKHTLHEGVAQHVPSHALYDVNKMKRIEAHRAGHHSSLSTVINTYFDHHTIHLTFNENSGEFRVVYGMQ